MSHPIEKVTKAAHSYLERVGFPGWRSKIIRSFADGAFGNEYEEPSSVAPKNRDDGTRQYCDVMRAAYDAGVTFRKTQ